MLQAIHELLREMANVQARVTDLQQHANNPKVQSLATQISNNISSSITAVSSTLTMQSGQATAVRASLLLSSFSFTNNAVLTTPPILRASRQCL